MQSGDHIPPNPQMENQMMRLASYSNMPRATSLSAAVASKAGLYYTGVGDTVACCKCGLRLNRWESGVHPMTVHRRLSAECLFVLDDVSTASSPEEESTLQDAEMMQLENTSSPGHQRRNTNRDRVPRKATSSLNGSNDERFLCRHMRDRINNNDPTLLEEMKSEINRLSSFASWPRDSNITPEALAKAGLFYLCRADRVKCAFCGGILCNWGPSEEPMRKHRQFFHDCPFLRHPMAAGNVMAEDEAPDSLSLVSFSPSSLLYTSDSQSKC